MIPVIYVYTKSYRDARRLFNTMYRPGIDKEMLCTEELWEDGEPLQITRDTEIWLILKNKTGEGNITERERKAAIEYIKCYRKMDEDMFNTAPQGSVSYFATKKCLSYWDMAIKALEQSGWIPTAERLPENDGVYFVTTVDKGQVQMHVFNHEGNSEEYWRRCNKAWMPLPEPYRAESEDECLDDRPTESGS